MSTDRLLPRYFNRWTIYRLIDADGECFYVGYTNCLPRRLVAHRQRFGDRIAKVRSRTYTCWERDARKREAKLIAELRPAENCLSNPDWHPERRRGA